MNLGSSNRHPSNKQRHKKHKSRHHTIQTTQKQTPVQDFIIGSLFARLSPRSTKVRRRIQKFSWTILGVFQSRRAIYELMSFYLRIQLRSQELVFQEKEFAASVPRTLTSRTFLPVETIGGRNTEKHKVFTQKSGISVLQHLLKILHSIVWLKIGGFDFAASSKFVLLAKPVQPPLPRSDIFTSSNLQCTKCNLSPGASSSNTLFEIEGKKQWFPHIRIIYFKLY